ncbi:MAG: BMP family ABC transporter substrate-binding protein [Chloroflexota bacterium]
MNRSKIFNIITILSLILSLIGGTSTVSAQSPGVCHVDADAVGVNDGSSWADAYVDLQSALGDSACVEIWVAAGVYKPGSGTNRSASFQLSSGVGLYGGFAGTETERDQRDWQANVSILSGDIDNNDLNDDGNFIAESIDDIQGDNSYHVVVGSGTDNTAVLDGFVVTAGETLLQWNVYPNSNGGGMFNENGSPTISHVTFSGNSGAWGGGMENRYSNPVLTDVTFVGNACHWDTAWGWGGGMLNYASSPILNDVRFISNSVYQDGGAMNNGAGSNPQLTNVTFIGNSAHGGGGIFNNGSSPTLTNILFLGNHADSAAGMVNYSSSSPTLTNVVFSGNYAARDIYYDSAAMTNSYSSNPILTNVTFSHNVGGNAVVVNTENSHPALVNDIMWGSALTLSGLIYNDATSTTTVTYSDLEGGYPGANNLDADPLFADADGADDVFGTADDDLSLLPGSPAIDAGDDANCPATDLRGVTRPQGAHCDMGAYESDAQPPTKVGLVTDEGGVDDLSFNMMAYQGLQQAETDLGITGTLYESASSDDYVPLLQQCADDGNDLCFAVGFSMADAIASVANANPDTAFAILDVDQENPPANLRGIRFDEKQAGYLAGALAGKMGEIVGVVGGIAVPAVVGFVEGYRNGAQCANPNATVLIEYTGTFTDPALGAATAQNMIDQGAHVIFGAAGGTGNGAILYSAGQGIRSIGVDTDQYLTLFGNGAVPGSYYLLTSAMKNLNVVVYRTIEDYLNGNFSSGTVTYHLADGGVGLAPYHEAYNYIPQPIRDYVEYDVKSGILDGSIDVNETCREEPSNPNFGTWDWHTVHGYNWPLGDLVTLTVDNDADPGNGTLYTGIDTSHVAPWNPDSTAVEYEVPFNLQVGHVMTMSDGIVTKTMTVVDIAVTSVDPVQDTVFGTAPAGWEVNIDLHNSGGRRHTVADGNGNWTADFAHAGLQEDEQDIVDLVPGISGNAYTPDSDGDSTGVNWRVPQPVVWAHPNDSEEDWIDARDWNFGETIQLTIDNDTDPSNGTLYTDSGVVGPANWNPSVGVKEFHLGDFDLQPGHIVTVGGPTTTKTLVITNLDVTDINPELDTISGTAVAGSAVQVWFHEEECNFETLADENGFWTVDFTPCDVRPGIGGGIGQMDADEDSTVYFWRVPNPTFAVRVNSNWIEANGWELGASLILEIDDPDNGPGVDYTDTQIVEEAPWDPNQTYVEIHFEGLYDAQPEDVVTLTDGVTSKTHIVTSIEITGYDLENDLVFGIADPDSYDLLVYACGDGNCSTRHVDSDGDGNWMADFGNPGAQDDEQDTYDIAGGTWLDAQQGDEDGDYTFNGLGIPNPTFGVRANTDQVEGWEWPLGATVTVTVDDPSTPAEPDATGSAVVYDAPWNPGEHRFDLDLREAIDILPGFVVTVTDGNTSKQHTVLDLTFTGIDVDADTVNGVGVPDSPVNVWTCDDIGCVNREEFADQDGNWSVDFSVPGDQDWEQATADLQYGSWIDSSQPDEDGDSTMFGLNVPNPNFSARLTENEVHGYEWPLGAPITLTIDDPATPEPVDYADAQTVVVADWDPNQTWVQFRLWENGFNLQGGMTVTMSDGQITKSHVVTSLTVTAVDPNADTVSGTAAPGTQVDIGHIYCDETGCYGFRREIADANGDWLADFSVPGEDDDEQDIVDITPGMGNEARQCDEDGDCTQYGWRAAEPRIDVRLTDYRIEAFDWPLGATVTLTVDDPATLDNPDLAQSGVVTEHDPQGLTWLVFDYAGAFDVQAGFLVTVSDGSLTKQIYVHPLAVTSVNVDTDQAFGSAAPGSQVWVYVWAAELSRLVNRYVTADASGSWTADFSVPGPMPEEQDVFDIVGNMEVAARQSDEDGDYTRFGYWTPKEPFIEVYPVDDEVVAANWPAGALATLTVDDPATPLSPDYTTSRIIRPLAGFDDRDTVVAFRLAGLFDIQPGYIVTLDDGVTAKTVVVTDLDVSAADPETDTITGAAAPGSDVDLDACGPAGIADCIWTRATADGSGQWSVEAAAQGYDLQPGVSGAAARFDEDGDSTRVRFAVVTPLPPDFLPTETVIVPAGGSIQIATLVDFSHDPWNTGLVNAVQMAMDDFGAIQGFGVTQTPYDSDCNEDFLIAQAAALDVIANPDYVGVIGHVCSASFEAGLPLYDSAGLVAISGSSTKFGTPNLGPGVSNRVILNDFYYDSSVWTQVVQAMPAVQEWNARYQARFGDEPGEFAVLYYDAAILLLDRIAETSVLQPDGSLLIARAALASAVRSTQNYEGVTGCFSLDGRGDRLPEEGDCNHAPEIEQITAPLEPVQIGQTTMATATFADPDPGDTHTALWDWGDGLSTTLLATPPTVSAFHNYTTSGVYTVTVTITDAAGASDTGAFQYVVIYDPSGGFVTGGGWFIDPASGAKAHFGFNPKYHKDGTLKGETEFKLDGLKFKSVTHDWLIISGAKAMFTGTGSVNGSGSYRFFVNVIDGKIAGGADRLRILIWDEATGEVIYDNQPGASIFADPVTVIGGGSIVVHKAR